jgi:hypothetical protein
MLAAGASASRGPRGRARPPRAARRPRPRLAPLSAPQTGPPPPAVAPQLLSLRPHSSVPPYGTAGLSLSLCLLLCTPISLSARGSRDAHLPGRLGHCHGGAQLCVQHLHERVAQHGNHGRESPPHFVPKLLHFVACVCDPPSPDAHISKTHRPRQTQRGMRIHVQTDTHTDTDT